MLEFSQLWKLCSVVAILRRGSALAGINDAFDDVGNFGYGKMRSSQKIPGKRIFLSGHRFATRFCTPNRNDHNRQKSPLIFSGVDLACSGIRDLGDELGPGLRCAADGLADVRRLAWENRYVFRTHVLLNSFVCTAGCFLAKTGTQ